MKFVADTNILFSFFNEKSAARSLVLNFQLEIFSPKFAIDELIKHREDVKERFSLDELQFATILKLLFSTIGFIESTEYDTYIPDAEKISPDLDDTDFFALSVKFKCPIWTEDKLLKQQEVIKIYSASDLLDLLNT